MTSDTRVMNDWKTTSVPSAATFLRGCVCMFTPIYVQEHLVSPKESASIGPADIWGHWKWPSLLLPSLHPLGEYLNFYFLCQRVLLPSHLPVLCPWMKKHNLLLTCDFVQQGISQVHFWQALKTQSETLFKCKCWVFVYEKFIFKTTFCESTMNLCYLMLCWHIDWCLISCSEICQDLMYLSESQILR